MSVRSYTIAAMLLIVALILGIGGVLWLAHDRHSSASNLDATLAKLDRLYTSYLQGDRQEATRALGDAISLLNDPRSGLPPLAQAQDLWLAYSRLCVVQSMGGNDSAADADLKEARVWYYRKLELGGAAAATAEAQSKEFTLEKCREIVGRWDLKYTSGKGPHYAEHSSSSSSSGGAHSELPDAPAEPPGGHRTDE